MRLRGLVHDAGPQAGRPDFLARPLASRVESLAGRQSKPLQDRAVLERAVEQARSRLLEDPELVLDHWALYRIDPDEGEFWQADPDRRHTRLSYTLDQERWVRSLLWP